MAGKYKSASQISQITNTLIDPILVKKAGINTMLLEVWEEIVGAEFADGSRPEKIIWPLKTKVDSETPEGRKKTVSGQLTISCQGSQALFLSHQKNEIMMRINAFFGFPAINRIKIVQKTIVQNYHNDKKIRKLSGVHQKKISSILKDVNNPKLKQALTKLGQGVFSRE